MTAIETSPTKKEILWNTRSYEAVCFALNGACAAVESLFRSILTRLLLRSQDLPFYGELDIQQLELRG